MGRINKRTRKCVEGRGFILNLDAEMCGMEGQPWRKLGREGSETHLVLLCRDEPGGAG